MTAHPAQFEASWLPWLPGGMGDGVWGPFREGAWRSAKASLAVRLLFPLLLTPDVPLLEGVRALIRIFCGAVTALVEGVKSFVWALRRRAGALVEGVHTVVWRFPGAFAVAPFPRTAVSARL